MGNTQNAVFTTQSSIHSDHSTVTSIIKSSSMLQSILNRSPHYIELIRAHERLHGKWKCDCCQSSHPYITPKCSVCSQGQLDTVCVPIHITGIVDHLFVFEMPYVVGVHLSLFKIITFFPIGIQTNLKRECKYELSANKGSFLSNEDMLGFPTSKSLTEFSKSDIVNKGIRFTMIEGRGTSLTDKTYHCASDIVKAMPDEKWKCGVCCYCNKYKHTTCVSCTQGELDVVHVPVVITGCVGEYAMLQFRIPYLQSFKMDTLLLAIKQFITDHFHLGSSKWHGRIVFNSSFLHDEEEKSPLTEIKKLAITKYQKSNIEGKGLHVCFTKAPKIDDNTMNINGAEIRKSGLHTVNMDMMINQLRSAAESHRIIPRQCVKGSAHGNKRVSDTEFNLNTPIITSIVQTLAGFVDAFWSRNKPAIITKDTRDKPAIAKNTSTKYNVCRLLPGFQKYDGDTMDVPVTIHGHSNGTFVITFPYSKSLSLFDLCCVSMQIFNQVQSPVIYKLKEICGVSFSGGLDMMINDRQDPQQTAKNTKITQYSKNNICNKGLRLSVEIQSHHRVNSVPITCEHIANCDEKGGEENALQCPVYSALKNYVYTEENLNHVLEYTHFKDEYNEKPKCNYGQGCKAYGRLQSGHLLKDRCHMKLYRHPPRGNTQINLPAYTAALKVHKHPEENPAVYEPTEEDSKLYGFNENDGYLNALIGEVKRNGFATDLCIFCRKNDDCTHDAYSILNDLCTSQRSGMYEKWKWFDYCLYKAISKLYANEKGFYKTYTGICTVKMARTDLGLVYFPTYVSASWKREVSLGFSCGDGMIIELDELSRRMLVSCDVSWVSRFPDECEILFARSNRDKMTGFQLSILDDHNDGLQMVSLNGNRLLFAKLLWGE
eukprot:494239_1